MTSQPTPRQDVYSRITDQIISSLEQGVKPWTQPWNAGHAAGPVSRPLRFNGEAYSGINILTLWASAMERSFAAPIWMTFRQAQELGGHVRKGEKGSPVVYANAIQRTETDERTGDDVDVSIPFMKGYTVFNVEQIDDLPAHYYALRESTKNPDERLAHAEDFFGSLGARILNGGNAAYYRPASDHIQMPLFEAFFNAQSYYATLAHESVHWTRHPSRLDRSFGRQRFGDAGYAKEELVAELGAAFLCADLELKLEDRNDHASYIGSWLQVLRNDKRAIFTAAAHAQRAVDYLHGLQACEEAAA
ncbi:zincin-like metallopeptidase domain-containing protein [Nitratireductor aquimarinus]|uniref:Zincin-like metallopeptidase domain-containing protein n=1 Tax=Nitratireductor aquimarinus TaxID=889300 RepID=A0ABU4AHD6_9HYPH|nr:zincin-like metallopeptidase domain-containing protein [Nitratireductor aquimarinus]MDV6225645.1 zincin-like metallopeptidase domain-containing protein [Nitratireductor aquimarinus]